MRIRWFFANSIFSEHKFLYSFTKYLYLFFLQIAVACAESLKTVCRHFYGIKCVSAWKLLVRFQQLVKNRLNEFRSKKAFGDMDLRENWLYKVTSVRGIIQLFCFNENFEIYFLDLSPRLYLHSILLFDLYENDEIDEIATMLMKQARAFGNTSVSVFFRAFLLQNLQMNANLVGNKTLEKLSILAMRDISELSESEDIFPVCRWLVNFQERYKTNHKNELYQVRLG